MNRQTILVIVLVAAVLGALIGLALPVAHERSAEWHSDLPEQQLLPASTYRPLVVTP